MEILTGSGVQHKPGNPKTIVQPIHTVRKEIAVAGTCKYISKTL